jgi:hypothetical protein
VQMHYIFLVKPFTTLYSSGFRRNILGGGPNQDITNKITPVSFKWESTAFCTQCTL